MQGKLYQEAEEYINDIFWAESHDKGNNLNIVDIIHAKLVRDNAEKDPEYYDHKEGVVHVTSLSKCLRGVVYEMLGTPKDAPMDARKLGVFKAGNLFEDFIVDALGEKMLDRQTEYIFKYKSIVLTGRDDGTMLHEGTRRMLECKSVHSDSFWYREKEGTLVATHNQAQIQTYLWLRRILPNMFEYRYPDNIETVYTNLTWEELIEYKGWKGKYLFGVDKPDNSELNGIFCYISKDDCTIAQAPVKFNENIINQVVIPAIEIVLNAYEKKDPNLAPVPPMAVYQQAKNQYQKNWIATYCEHHNSCCGAGWILEANEMVAVKNREIKNSMPTFAHTIKKVKPQIEVVESVESTEQNKIV